MNKREKNNLLILVMAAIIGFLGSYSANYLFAFFATSHDEGVYHVFSNIFRFFLRNY